jgi:hypothetical protein
VDRYADLEGLPVLVAQEIDAEVPTDGTASE